MIFLRHGATLWNRQGRYQGLTDTELSAKGTTQAANNATLIEQLIKAGILDCDQLTIVSSPLQRAKQTADIIARSFDNKILPTLDPAFRELSMGRWEGLTSQQVKDRYYLERKSRKTMRWEFAPLGGDSLSGRKLEVLEGLSRLRPNSIIVTHSGILRILLHVLGEEPVESAATTEILHVGLLVWDGAILHRQAGTV